MQDFVCIPSQHAIRKYNGHLNAGQITYLKCLIGSSQLPSLMHVDKSARVWIICSCGRLGPKANASLIISDSRAPPKKQFIQSHFNELDCVIELTEFLYEFHNFDTYIR